MLLLYMCAYEYCGGGGVSKVLRLVVIWLLR